MNVMEARFGSHLGVIAATVRAGFRFRYLPSLAEIDAVQGFRVRAGAMDVYLVRAEQDALAARFRVDDLEDPVPHAIWHRRGSVADVVADLLALPAHGTPGAPTAPLRCREVGWIFGLRS
ncbi:hypothetical protein ABZ805_28795 [Saccharopolyspora sp. NPDC047091]|uniref:hypothetical protein n=1 Tax=Saccharopolyspora sp. NPDC047091 TaxID=3155924 RepID=UPI0033DA93C8